MTKPTRADMSSIEVEHNRTDSPPRPSFKSFYFSSGLGYACYYFFRNDWVWSRLTEQEKSFVKQQNDYWNNNNPGYKNPEEYQGQGGQSFRTVGNREESWEGRQLQLFLDRERPRRVLEIGPGSGYYTRQIIDHGSVEEYIATDINVKFLKYIKGAISEHPRCEQVRTEFVQIGELDSLALEVDAIIMLSALHHIPDRERFINHISRLLVKGGSIFFYEPTHSLARIVPLSWSFIVHRWYSTKAVTLRNNYMTHHFCTVAETRNVAKQSGLDFVWWDVKSKLPSRFRRLAAPFSKKMIAVLQKPKHP
jgi:SAM-dependent methyltransferase